MVEEIIINFISNFKMDDIDSEIIEKAKHHILDTIGVTVAANCDYIGESLNAFYRDFLPPGKIHVIGSSLRLPLIDAVFFNGTLAHALDYDDSSWTLIGHPSAVITPTALAVGEYVGASGEKILGSYILGTEVACKMGVVLEPYLYERGWHATSAIGVLGAAVTASYLLNLDEKKFRMALGIASSSASGLRKNFGTMTKPYHAGMAARNGVVAACLAKSGFTSNENALCGEGGYASTLAGITCTEDIHSKLRNSLGNPYEIITPGFFVKPYPSCAATHSAIDAMLSIMLEEKINPEQIETVEVGSGRVGPIMLTYHRPQKGFEGKFCMPYVIAEAILRKKVGIDSFTTEQVKRPEAQRMMDKIKFYIHPELEKKPISEAPAILKVNLKDGRKLTKRVDLAKGNPNNPLSFEDLLEKYRDCTSRVLDSTKIKQSAEHILNMEELKSIDNLMVLVTKEQML